MPGIREEMIVFLVAVVSGAVVRLAYQCIRCLRRIVEHKLLAISVEDAIFWVGSAIYMFVQIYHTSDGSIRWYFVLGVALGTVFMTIFLRGLKSLSGKIYGGRKKDLSSGS